MAAATIYREVGKRIRRIRRAQDISQAALADAIGYSRVTIVNIEAGKQRPPIHVIYAIAYALDVRVYRLLPASEG